jgi:hypothetical protein
MNNSSFHLTVALTPRNLAPGIQVHNRQILHSTGHEGVIKVLRIRACLDPLVLWIAEEHTEQVARAALGRGTVGGARVHDAEVIDELDVAFLAVQLRAVFLGELLDGVESTVLCGGEGGHAGVADDAWAAEQGGFDKLDDRLAFREEESRAEFEVRLAIPV